MEVILRKRYSRPGEKWVCFDPKRTMGAGPVRANSGRSSKLKPRDSGMSSMGGTRMSEDC
jgi:hypothetical protein